MGDVDIEGRRILVKPKSYWKPKGKEERAIPMHEARFYGVLVVRWSSISLDTFRYF